MIGPLRRRLSCANVVASIALFVALGGTGYAAITITGKNVKNGSLTGTDVKNGSLGTVDVKNGSLLSKDFKAGQLVAAAPGARGPQGPVGEAGTARAYALVNSDGSVDESRSKGVSDANVSADSNTYCFSGLSFTPKNAMVTLLESYKDVMVEMGACQFRVVIGSANGFMVLIN